MASTLLSDSFNPSPTLAGELGRALDGAALWDALFLLGADGAEERASRISAEIDAQEKRVRQARQWLAVSKIWAVAKRHPWALRLPCWVEGNPATLNASFGLNAEIDKKRLFAMVNPDRQLRDDDYFSAAHQETVRCAEALEEIEDAAAFGWAQKARRTSPFMLDLRDLQSLARSALDAESFAAWEACALARAASMGGSPMIGEGEPAATSRAAGRL
jgi:hypothetical protein